MAVEHGTAHRHRTVHLYLSPLVQAALVLAVVGVVLWVTLFSTTAFGLHDRLHEFRHALGIIPCH